MIEVDLHEVYGIDLRDPAIRRRSWHWFRLRAFGLLSTDSRLHRMFYPPE